MDTRLKIAVIGAGEIAEVAYLPNLNAPDRGYEVAYVCDKDAERLKWAKSVCPSAKMTSSLDEVLADKSVNWVFILTPLLTHAAIAKKALAAGKNVFTEKPLSVDFAKAASVVAFAKKKGLVVASAPIMILYPAKEYVRSLLLGGAIGKVASARVIVAHGGPDRWERKTDSGIYFRKELAGWCAPIPDLAVYGLSYLSHVFGPAKRVSAMAALAIPERRIDKVAIPGFKPYTLKPTIKDNITVNIEYPGGFLATIHANFCTSGWQPDRYEFYGSEGTMTLPYKALHAKIQSFVPPHNSPDSLHDLDLSGRNGGAQFSGVNWGPIVAQHLKKAADLGAEPLVGASFTLHVCELISKAMKSARSGNAEKLTTTFKRDPAWNLS
jgi:predicted dehydrogenase